MSLDVGFLSVVTPRLRVKLTIFRHAMQRKLMPATVAPPASSRSIVFSF